MVMTTAIHSFKHVSYLWDEAKAAELGRMKWACLYIAPICWEQICA